MVFDLFFGLILVLAPVMKNRIRLVCSLLCGLMLYPWVAQAQVKQHLKQHVQVLTAEDMQGRKAGSPGEEKAATYVYDCLSSYGLQMLCLPSGQDFSIVQAGDTLHSRNIVGGLEGYDPQLRNQFVVVGANLDHMGVNRLMHNGQEQMQLFPGADNNASGLAVLLEMAQQMAQTSFLLRRSVVFVAFGAGELGQAGSWYFVNRAFPQVDSVSVMVDLHQVGRPGGGYRYYYFTGGPHQQIAELVQVVGDDSGYPAPAWNEAMSLSSDYLAFYERQLPAVLFTNGRTLETNTVRDQAATLNYDAMEALCGYALNFVLQAARQDDPLEWGSTHPSPDGPADASQEIVYAPRDVDKAPEFFHGDERRFLEQWVYDYLRYPDYSLSQGIQGTVMVSFIVEKDGSVTHVQVVRGVEEDLDQEAVRVVSASPKWKPGQVSGRKVRVKYTIPIEFRLEKR